MERQLYESMFLVDSAIGEDGISEVIRHIKDLLGRFGGEIERVEKWDERQLAYPIERIQAGIYILIHFTAETASLSDIRRVLNISERITRFLILRAESVPPSGGVMYSPDGEILETASGDDVSETEAEDGDEGDEEPDEEGEEEAAEEVQSV